jgi:hypothetical protein
VIIPSVKLADTVLPFGRVMTSPLVDVLPTTEAPTTTKTALIVTVEPEPSGPRSKGVPSKFLSFPIASKVTGVLYVVTTFGSSTALGPLAVTALILIPATRTATAKEKNLMVW